MVIDFAKAFDTIEWSFLIQTLQAFGFGSVFIGWIQALIHSAYLSFLVNGKTVGFFSAVEGSDRVIHYLLFCSFWLKRF